MTTKWHYNLLSEFNRQYFRDIVTMSHICSGRTPIKMDDGTYLVFYVFNKDRKLLAIEQEYINQVPLRVKTSFEKIYNKQVYDIVTNATSVMFTPEESFSSFKEFVDTFLDFEVTNKEDFTLMKIIGIASYISRMNVRVTTPPAAGKDSIMKTLGALLGDVVVISNPTIAKLEYSLNNKVLTINETSNLSKENIRDIEQFLLSTGDFSPVHTKRSRAGKGSQESYDISKLSTVLFFNNLECYSDVGYGRFFDFSFQSAVLDRFLPLTFDTRITQKFELPLDIPAFVRDNLQFYKSFVNYIEWMKTSFHKYKPIRNLDPELYGVKGRWGQSFGILLRFIDWYAGKDHLMFGKMAGNLLDAHTRYLTMIKEGEGMR